MDHTLRETSLMSPNSCAAKKMNAPKREHPLRDVKEEETLSISRESKEIAKRALEISENNLSEAKRSALSAREQV